MKNATVILFYLLPFFVVAQEKNDSAKISKNTIFIEVLGNGIIGSINYDKVMKFRNHKISYRIGLGYLPINSDFQKIYSVPIEFNSIHGNEHNIEFGIGATYAYGFNSDNDPSGNQYSSSAIYATLRVFGYRYQRIDGGFFLKTGLLAFMEIVELNFQYKNVRKNDPPVFPSLGLGIGYTFKTKK